MESQLTINTALIFNGQCAEAIPYYERIFNIKAKKVLRYKDVPEIKHDHVYPRMKDFAGSELIRMAVLEIGGVTFRLLDLVDSMSIEKTEQIAFMIIGTVENVKQYYENMLKEGAEIHVPPQKRFFSEFNAVVVDKFGYKWTFEGGYKF